MKTLSKSAIKILSTFKFQKNHSFLNFKNGQKFTFILPYKELFILNQLLLINIHLFDNNLIIF